MIDWLSFSVPYRASTVADRYLKQVYGNDDLEAAYTRPVGLQGSYDSRLSVMATGSRMYISGNPVKWLTGQNVVGSDDIHRLVSVSFDGVLSKLGLPDCLEARRALSIGDVSLTRVDCTFSYEVGSSDDVDAFLRSLGERAHVKHRGRGHFSPQMSSLYFGVAPDAAGRLKGSRRSVFKLYNKHRELEVHPLSCHERHHAPLKAMAYGSVRGEATFRSLELKRMGYDILSIWTEKTSYSLHRSWISKMQITDNVRLSDHTEDELPRKLRSTYLHWRQGEDLRRLLPRNTFYRHRNGLLEFGVDIALPCPSAEPSQPQVIPVIRILEAKPVYDDQDDFFWSMVAEAA